MQKATGGPVPQDTPQQPQEQPEQVTLTMDRDTAERLAAALQAGLEVG